MTVHHVIKQIREVTGIFFYKAVSSFKPNYYIDYLKDSPWIQMPFEKYEDIILIDLKK